MKLLLKLFPLETLLKSVAQLLLNNQSAMVDQVLLWIKKAEEKLTDGSEKFAWVKENVTPLLKGKAGWAVDTAIQLLVALIRTQAAKAAGKG